MIVALLPGGFKPPHAGHYEAAKYLADYADKVLIKIGPDNRGGGLKYDPLGIDIEGGITPEIAKEFWEEYIKHDSDPRKNKIEIELSSLDTPVRDVYSYVENPPKEVSKVVLGLGEKENDTRYQGIPKAAEKSGINYEIVKIPPQAGGASGSATRDFALTKNEKNFINTIPKFLPDEVKDGMWSLLTQRIKIPSEEEKKLKKKISAHKSRTKNKLKEFMGGTMNAEEMAKHMANMKKLRKFLNKPNDQMVQVPTKLTKGLRRKLYEGIDKNELRKGIKVEKEHTNDPRIAMKIALDHLAEDPKYYTKLATLGLEEQLHESRKYEEPTLKISRIILDEFKNQLNNKYEEEEWSEYWLEGPEYIVFFDIGIKFTPDTKFPIPFSVEGESGDEDIQIKIKYNPENFPKAYNALNAEIKDTVRHELEHLGQYNFPNKEFVENYKGKIPWVKYLTLNHEVPAYVKGLYKRAKYYKVPLFDMFEEYFNDFKNYFNSEDEIETVRKTWRAWANINLPNVQLNEIGEGNLKPFKYKEAMDMGDISPSKISNKSSSSLYKNISSSEFIYFIDSYIIDSNNEKLKVPITFMGSYERFDPSLWFEPEIEEFLLKFKIDPYLFTFLQLNFEHDQSVDDEVRRGAYDLVNDTNFMFRLMATFKKILQQEISSNKPDAITYIPNPIKSKGERGAFPTLTGRHKLYNAFITKAFPNATAYNLSGNIFYLLSNLKENFPPYTADQVQKVRYQSSDTFTHSPKKAKKLGYLQEKDPKTGTGKKKTQRMKKEGLFSQKWWLNIITEEILNEGGAAGHMAHPFDLPNVNTGKDLIKSFEQAADSLKKQPGSVKIDGVNSSIRLANNAGKRQFVIDRGSKKELDLRGVTKGDLADRFGSPEHGMVKAGGKVLDIFNEALPSIVEELKALGVYDNSNVMFNMEYVSGKSNVQDYGKNFLAIHGLLNMEIKDVIGKSGKTLQKRIATEKKYDKADMDELLKKLEPFAKKKGFEIYGSVPTTFTKEPDFESALNTKYTIDFAEGDQTKTLSQWLNNVTNIPLTDRIKMNINGTIKDVGAVSKQVYFAVFGGENVDDLFDNEQDLQKAIQGATTYLATEKLGDAILDVLDSPMGSVNDHEGVVIRDPKISKQPFKITGKFITGGVSSQFQQKK